MGRHSNRIPGCLIMICVMLSGTILPTGLLLLAALFYGREFLQHEALMGLTAVQWLVVGTLLLMGWVVILRTLFLFSSRWITRNNQAKSEAWKTRGEGQPVAEGE
jgi:hypothetical protein